MRPRFQGARVSGDLFSQALLPQLPGYRFVRKLGEGGAGSVYKAVRERDGATVALKLIFIEPVADDEHRGRFEREIELTKALRYPNIVELYDHGSEGNHFYFAMEFCEGGSLADLLARRGAPLPFSEACAIMTQVLDGLAHAHRKGVVHRDLNPHNILLTAAEDGVAKIADFGIAKVFDEIGLSQELTRTGVAIGTGVFTAEWDESTLH